MTTAAIALVCWLTMAAGRAEQADSGWVVGIPSTSTMPSRAPDPAAQMVLERILEQSRIPLLRTPSPTAKVPQSVDKQSPSARVAQKIDGIDGWRPTHESITQTAPLPVSDKTRLSAPTGSDAKGPNLPRASQGVPSGRPNNGAPPASVVDEPDTQNRQDTAVEFRPPNIDALPTIRFGGTPLSSPSYSSSVPEEKSPSPRAVLSAIEPAPAATIDILDAARATGLLEITEPVEITVTDQAIEDRGPSEIAEPILPIESGDAALNAPSDAPREAVTQAPVETQTAPPASEATPIYVDPEADRGRGQAGSQALPPLSRQLMNLRTKVRSVLRGYSRKSLNSREHDPWEVMHGMLAYELQSKIHQGGPRGELITSVGWLCYNKPCKNLTLMYVTPEGELRAKQGVGLQGHKGQLLAMLAQCRVSPNYPIRVGKHHFTVSDLIEAEKKTCYPRTELTFKLIAFTHYLDLNEKWVNDEGLNWDMPRVIREELAQPIRGAACGGTHRLSGLTFAVKARERRGEPIDGEYLRAADYLEKYENYAFRLQNSDGSLSTKWFQGRGDEDDDDRRVKTTGHILEWLVYSLSDEELREQRMIRAVNYLASLLYSNYDHEWEIGPRSHAIHALLRYDERVFRPYDGSENVASQKSTQPSARRPSRSMWR